MKAAILFTGALFVSTLISIAVAADVYKCRLQDGEIIYTSEPERYNGCVAYERGISREENKIERKIDINSYFRGRNMKEVSFEEVCRIKVLNEEGDRLDFQFCVMNQKRSILNVSRELKNTGGINEEAFKIYFKHCYDTSMPDYVEFEECLSRTITQYKRIRRERGQ